LELIKFASVSTPDFDPKVLKSLKYFLCIFLPPQHLNVFLTNNSPGVKVAVSEGNASQLYTKVIIIVCNVMAETLGRE
jgi:hypothetical protein